MFQDYPHNVKKINIDNKKFIIKTLYNKEILKKEFEIMKFIEPFNISPKVFKIKDNKIVEEYVDGSNLNNISLDDELIIKLADKINILHRIKSSKKIKEILKDSFIVNDRYQPFKIFQFIIDNISSHINYIKLKDFFIKYEKYLEDKNYNIGIVHGDLTPGNIVLSKSGLCLLDWTDCRYDILSCDVSQLFYSFNFSKQQRKIFLERYKATYVDDTVLEMHYLLLLLFDLSNVFRKTGKFNKEIAKRVNNIIDKYGS